jgi:hypothetical protein
MSVRPQTPRENRQIVAEPGFGELTRLVELNRRLFRSAKATIPLPQLRDLARAESLTPKDGSPLILSGHQPELYHPGVWVKNFAVMGLAQKLHGHARNLIVDNDLVKSAELRLPVWDRWYPAHVRTQSVPLTSTPAQLTWETATIEDDSHFQAVPERIRQLTQNWGYQPILHRVWPALRGHNLGERFTRARQLIERDFGCEIRDYPVRNLSISQAFRHFANHLRNDHQRFGNAYNRAVQTYRQKYRLRSKSHPVPELAEGELAFWDATDPEIRAKATVATPIEKLRPRALTLTLFARLCLGDFFIHGIGGGKYDEVTDSIIRSYFDMEPPKFQILSGTLRLPLPQFESHPSEVSRLVRLIRDQQWNPQRYLGEVEMQEHRELTQLSPTDRRGRRERSRRFRGWNQLQQSKLIAVREKTSDDLAQAKAEVAANQILQNREYAWVLFPEESLREFLQGVQHRAATG